MEDEKVRQLAETLKKNNLAASMSEAIEKAKSILNVKPVKTDNIPGQQGKKSENIPLNELMKEVSVEPEQVKIEEEEKIDHIRTEIRDIKEDIKEAEKKPEKMEQVKEEIAQVKEEADKIMETKSEEDDRFKEEKKIDLTKIFNNKK